MRLNSLEFTVVLLTLILLFSCTANRITYTLKGKVNGVDYDTLMLKRANEDARFTNIFIPIINGEFEYKIEMEYIEAWELILKSEYLNGPYRATEFFNDAREIVFDLYPGDQFRKTKICGGKLNKARDEHKTLQRSISAPIDDSLRLVRNSFRENNKIENPEYTQLNRDYWATDNGSERDLIMKNLDSLVANKKQYTPEYYAFRKQSNLRQLEGRRWRYDYMRENHNILSYWYILEDLLVYINAEIDEQAIREIYPTFAKKYPDHPYTAIVSGILDGLENIKVGGKYIDFSLPDLSGSIYTLSTLIEGKVAVIDLWSTYCGPCIRHSRELVPLFNEFQNSDFTVVGVAAERNNTDDMKELLKREKWPWINLVDLDHNNHIWDTYGVSFGGGMLILIDRKGTIIAKQPSVDEIRKLLSDLL